MSTTHSPLRYPGGKSALLPLLRQILRLNKLRHGSYAEPYAGGASLALALLFGGDVYEVHLNDLDRPIWAFWDAVLNRTEDFAEAVEAATVSVDEWHRQRAILHEPKTALGFAAFFLNRTNRSGIIKNAGVIGGLAQTGTYKIDCRFNKPELARRIRRIGRYSDRIHLSRLDALKFLDRLERQMGPDVFCCIDPPYFHKGSSLYASFYRPHDHAAVAARVLEMSCPWVVTYDDTPEIRALYRTRRQYALQVRYAAQTKRMGSEILVASKRLRIPDGLRADEIDRTARSKAA